MEPENDGLEDAFPFQTGDFLDSMLTFRGVSKYIKYAGSLPEVLFWYLAKSESRSRS